jgi:hypothetical protein
MGAQSSQVKKPASTSALRQLLQGATNVFVPPGHEAGHCLQLVVHHGHGPIAVTVQSPREVAATTQSVFLDPTGTSLGPEVLIVPCPQLL